MKLHLSLKETPIKDLMTLTRKPIGDPRGYFERLFCLTELVDLLNGRVIHQINHSFTSLSGSVRGMHFQLPPHTETKIVSCIRGEVFDVAIDLRKDSPTFMKWYGEILSPSNYRTMLIPDGFAHGFQTLTNDCEMLYFHTCKYSPESEQGLNSIDPRIMIPWPLEITDRSSRDSSLPLIDDGFEGIRI